MGPRSHLTPTVLRSSSSGPCTALSSRRAPPRSSSSAARASQGGESDGGGCSGGGSDGSADGLAVAAGLVSPTKAVALQRVPVFSPTPLGTDEQKTGGGGYRDIIDDMEDEDYEDSDENDKELDEMDHIDVDDIDRFAGASPRGTSPRSPGGARERALRRPRHPSSTFPSPGAFSARDRPLSFKDVALLKLKEKRKRERRQKLLAIKKMRAMAERSNRRAEAAKRRQLHLPEQQQRGSGGGSSSLDDASRAAVLGTIEDFNKQSLRSLALAHRCLSPDETAALLDAEMAAAAAAAHGGSGFHVSTGGGGGGGNTGEPTLGDLGLSVEQWDGLGLDAGLTLDAVVGKGSPPTQREGRGGHLPSRGDHRANGDGRQRRHGARHCRGVWHPQERGTRRRQRDDGPGVPEPLQ